MMKRSRNWETLVVVFLAFLFVAIAFFSSQKIDESISEYALESALSELDAMTEEQVSLTRHELFSHFSPLKYLEQFLEEGYDFTGDECSTILEVLTSTNNWDIIGYADKSGNAVSSDGSSLGNVSEQAFFSDIMSKRSSEAVGYITGTCLQECGEYIFSIPCYTDGEITGVLFACMDVPMLNHIFDAYRDGDVIILFVDSSGYVLGANPPGSSYVNKNIFFNTDDAFFADETTVKAVKESMYSHESGRRTFDDSGRTNDLIFKWVGLNDWYIIVMAFPETFGAKELHAVTGTNQLLRSIVADFALIILFIFASCALYLVRISRAEKLLSFEKMKNDLILHESGDEQFVYDVRTKTITGKGSLVQIHDNNIPKDLSTVIKGITSLYPEVESDLEKIVEAIHSVSVNGEKEVFDRPMTFYGNIRWIRMVFVPYMADGKNVSHVFASMCDTTYLHQEFERSLQLLKNLPGGFHRCYLNNPIHVEYISDGLCKLLGYTHEEITKHINSKYSLLIHEEDRALFREFAYKLAEKEAIMTCEYRMICKNGDIITVSDTMESLRGSDGVMYGYSAVTDISEKAEQLETAKEKIKKSEERELELLDEQLLLAAAARNAYSMIISVNLTQNSYYMVEYENFTTKTADESGSFDDLIMVGASTVPDAEQSEMFRRTLDRKNLIQAYQNGEKTISIRHKQLGDDGAIHWIDTRVVFVAPNENGDIREITLVRNADEEQGMVDDLQESLRKESVYREAIMANCAGYMEINFSTGYIEGDILSRSKGGELEKIQVPELGSPVEFDSFENWWAEHMVVSDRDAFKYMCNSKYILSMFAHGNRYVEVRCRTKLMAEQEFDCIEMYFLSKDETSGDIKGICVLSDITELEQRRAEISYLSEELSNVRIKNSVSQMQPHFLYNALASIREIILDDPQYASDLICDFTTHLRACIKAISNNDLIPFSQELENIKAYVNIEKMRFGSKLKIIYNINCEDFMIVPLSIQPLVENSIRHGIYERGAKGGTLWISAEKDNDSFKIVVKDDGVGFDYEKLKEEVLSEKRDSTGLRNTVFRLETILHATVSIQSKIGVGTDITIIVPHD